MTVKYLEDFEAGRVDAVPKAWRLCFNAAIAGTGSAAR